MYHEPTKWAFAFQSYVMLKMTKSHLHHATTKIIERSLGSAQNVFLKAHQMQKTINHTQAAILEEWYSLLISNLAIRVDLIIYLRIDPETAMQRIKKRNRFEERDITIEYIKILDGFYNLWLLENPGVQVITLDASQSTDKILTELNKKLDAKRK